MKTYVTTHSFKSFPRQAGLTKVLTDGMNEERYTVTASGTCCGCTDVTSLFALSGLRLPESGSKEDALTQSFNDLGRWWCSSAGPMTSTGCYLQLSSWQYKTRSSQGGVSSYIQ